MTYTETLDKIQAHGLTRDAANTLVFNAECNGEQSSHGVAVIATEVAGTLRYTYDVHTEI